MNIHKALSLLNIKVKDFIKINHDNTISSTVYKITSYDKNDYILKFNYNKKKFIKESYFLEILQNLYPVPRIFQILQENNYSKEAILMENLPGSIGNTYTFSSYLSYKMGELLAKLHNINIKKLPKYLPNLTPNYDISLKIEKDFLESINECKNVLPVEILNKTENYYKKHKLPSNSYSKKCILHGDFRPENLIIHNNKITGVIDFEGSNFVCNDLDFLRLHLLTWKNNDKFKKEFLEGYKNILNLPNLEETLPFLKFIKTLGVIGFTCYRKTYNNKHSNIFNDSLNVLFEILKTN